MIEQVHVTMPTEVPGLDDAADFYAIESVLSSYVLEHTDRLNLEILKGWKLTFSIVSRSTNAVGVFKRSKRYPSAQEFEISISVSIPNEAEADYGLASAREAYYFPMNERNFHILDPMYDAYSNLNDYIIESSRRAFQVAFTAGIVMNGKKLQLRNKNGA